MRTTPPSLDELVNRPKHYGLVATGANLLGASDPFEVAFAFELDRPLLANPSPLTQHAGDTLLIVHSFGGRGTKCAQKPHLPNADEDVWFLPGTWLVVTNRWQEIGGPTILVARECGPRTQHSEPKPAGRLDPELLEVSARRWLLGYPLSGHALISQQAIELRTLVAEVDCADPYQLGAALRERAAVRRALTTLAIDAVRQSGYEPSAGPGELVGQPFLDGVMVARRNGRRTQARYLVVGQDVHPWYPIDENEINVYRRVTGNQEPL